MPYRTRLILWVAMVMSIATYYVVVQVVRPAPEPNAQLGNVLLLVAFSMVAVTFVLKGRLPQPAGYIVALALCESAAIFGIVVAFVAGAPRFEYFIALGLVGMALHFPRADAS